MTTHFKRMTTVIGIVGCLFFGVATVLHAQEDKPLKLNTTADHAKFKEL
jgi:hypothetical protein